MSRRAGQVSFWIQWIASVTGILLRYLLIELTISSLSLSVFIFIQLLTYSIPLILTNSPWLSTMVDILLISTNTFPTITLLFVIIISYILPSDSPC